MIQTQGKILTLEPLKNQINNWKKQNLTIVFTNGCFDLIHLGHVDYLEKSRNLGDKLIIGLNSDQSVKKIKGPGRPILDEVARARILSSFQFVDAVILFSDETPLNLIREVKPDVLVKGNDYKPENIVGAEIVKSYGGKVITVSLIPGYSTTEIIKKIENN
jgi:rfaE bifunctional protein nucleotidyltransferase chain/domain